MKIITLKLFMIISILCSMNCNSSSFDDSCITHDKVVDLMQKKLTAANDDDFEKFRKIVYAENDEIKKLAFENVRSLYNLCRLIDRRVSEEAFDEKTEGSTQVYNGVRLINKLFRDDWQQEKNELITISKLDRYDGASAYFNNIRVNFLVICINGEIQFDLVSSFVSEEKALQWYRIIGTKEAKRNKELMNQIIAQDVQNWDGFTKVMRMKDWSVRVDSEELE